MQNLKIQNYKFIITFIRFVLMLIVAISVFYIVSNFFSSNNNQNTVQDLSIKVSSVESYASNPEFLGTDKDDMPFKIEAEKGTQKDGKNFELDNITAKYMQKNEEMLTIDSHKAQYNIDSKTLKLFGDVHAKNLKGDKVHASEVDWDLGNKMMNGHGEVNLSANFGTIESDNFAVSESYTKLEFYNNSGRVKATLNK